MHPTNEAECAGGTVTFTVAATGVAAFQWRKNTINIPGATASAYSIVGVATGDAGSYDCVLTNACGSSTSFAALLVVSNGNPTITAQPASVIACTGDAVAFSVTATGALEYQWRKNNSNIPGATSATYAIGSAASGDAGSYDCVVTNACGSVTSSAATLTISDILYVRAGAAGANTGKTWADAFTSLQSALQSTRATVQIWVSAGTYAPDGGTGNRAATFQLVSNKSVYGGFAGTETLLSQRDPKANVTILSGEIGAAGAADDSLHVVTGSGAGSSAVLDGFTIRGGNADAGNGGGILISAGSPRITRCVITNNRAGNGGGAYVELAPSASIVNCDFRGNIATDNGGALALGAGVPASVANCAFSGNSAASGGAIHNSGSLALTSSTLSRNSASASGGGVRTGGSLTFANTILWANSDAGGTTESAQISVASGTASGTYSVVQGLAAFAGTGNIATNPDLIDPDGFDNIVGNADDDLRLSGFSPCIDAGSSAALAADTNDLDGDGNLAEPLPMDIVGNPRQLDDPQLANGGAGPAPICDIGAHELCTCEQVPFGTGTPGCAGTMVAGVSEPPKINTPTFMITCTNAPPLSLGLGLITNVADVPGSDPFAIGVLLHSSLFFSTEVLTFDFLSDAAGNGAFAAPIPNLPILVGAVYFAQGLWFDPGCSLPPFNLTTSRGLKLTILP
jgi:predicted outer membrane repeat protein